MSHSFCKDGKGHFGENCPNCDPNYTAGRGMAHASADILARFSMNLPRVSLADLFKKPLT